MADGFVQIASGEKRPVYAQLTALEGTITIEISPLPSLSLYDSEGDVIHYGPPPGVPSVPINGYDPGAQEAPRVWYDLDTSAWGLAVGFYTLVFTIYATGSDAIARVYKPSIELQVIDAVR